MQRMLTRGCEDAALSWLKGAIEYAYSHGHRKTLAYLEAVVADMVFESRATSGRASVIE